MLKALFLKNFFSLLEMKALKIMLIKVNSDRIIKGTTGPA